jgi:predicted Zn-dependent protease
MQKEFYALADHVQSLLRDGELFNCTYSGEVSDFVRFNKSAIRQPGRVTQHYLTVDLIQGMRHAGGTIALTQESTIDRDRCADLVQRLRSQIPELAEDPHLLYATEVRSSERIRENRLPAPEKAVDAILSAGKGRDLVGIYASGGVYAGFANSFGQRNWFASYSFNFDWSFYLSGDKAVKSAYAGFEWDPVIFDGKVESAAAQLAVLSKPARKIPPGHYRVYLTPTAMYEIMGTISWGGFGMKDNRTRNSSLLKLIAKEATLSEMVMIHENAAGGVAPDFQAQGFIKDPKVTMIERGVYKDSLISPRSAKEYGLQTNGANSYEMPEALDMEGGDIPIGRVLEKLDTGLYISNLWYLNYSDRPACRMTGMTRFATLWVENGKIREPVEVMRFDETLYRMLGEKLVGLTRETEMILDAYTYEARSTGSGRLPGAIIDDFTFTL